MAFFEDDVGRRMLYIAWVKVYDFMLGFAPDFFHPVLFTFSSPPSFADNNTNLICMGLF